MSAQKKFLSDLSRCLDVLVEYNSNCKIEGDIVKLLADKIDPKLLMSSVIISYGSIENFLDGVEKVVGYKTLTDYLFPESP